MRNFATCHCHPQSLDSASTPEAFVKRELELGTGVITCTDHGTLQACRKIYDLGKAKGLTPVLGLEAYLRDDNCEILAANGYEKNERGAFVEAPKYMHVTIHFMDQAAYECGVRLLSAADNRFDEALERIGVDRIKFAGKERKPLFTWRDLEELGAQNTTMTTGCMIGLVQRHLLDNDDPKTARGYFEKLKAIVKPGNLYTEVFPHDTSKNWVEGIFVTLKDGTKQRYWREKVLLTDVGEIDAARLARVWNEGKHHVLKSVKDRNKWREMPEQEIANVEHVEAFLPNECRKFAPDGDLQAGLNRFMKILAGQYGVKILIGDDSHFAHPEEKIVQDVRLSQDGSWRFYGSYHRQSSEEAFEHFKRKNGVTEAEFEGWVENSHEWASRFKDFVFETPVSLPTKFYEAEYEKRDWFKPGDSDNSVRYTLDLIKKHGRMDWKDPVRVARLRAEMNLLHHNKTIDLLPYFFIDEEVCSLYEQAGLLTGPGRGSAAGLLLTFLLGITHVDPLKYGLSMDRFLTVDRIKSGKLPDIDQDLPHRDLLVDPEKGWLRERFGDHYAQISVDTTLKLKMAVKDVARSTNQKCDTCRNTFKTSTVCCGRSTKGFVPPDIEIFTKKFAMPPQGVNDFDFVMGYQTDEGWIQGSIETDEFLKDYIRAYPKDWEVVKKCLGLARQKSRHACFPGGEAIFLSCNTTKRIEECDGHTVLTENQIPARATLLHQGEREVVEYRLENGNKIRCTPDHMVMTERGWMGIELAMQAGVELVLANVGATGNAARQKSTQRAEADGSCHGRGEQQETPPGNVPSDTRGRGRGRRSRRPATGADVVSTTHGSSTRRKNNNAQSGCVMSIDSTIAKPAESSVSTSPTVSVRSDRSVRTAIARQRGSIESKTH